MPHEVIVITMTANFLGAGAGGLVSFCRCCILASLTCFFLGWSRFSTRPFPRHIQASFAILWQTCLLPCELEIESNGTVADINKSGCLIFFGHGARIANVRS
ncbi:unnamed protein product [Ostreobium quekettii]|uniref:Uncharacterized protein n=1 Tax=Ostreobium quekettii TaxID=121088 RepID=A0A8S1JF28_9CHLO|nr:unnamed protein product [Ostreobium quekettii]